jgi:hypothetical protein
LKLIGDEGISVKRNEYNSIVAQSSLKRIEIEKKLSNHRGLTV